MNYWRKGSRDGLGVEVIPGHPTSFVTVWLWRLRLQAMWRS